jgi:hypothetical protein
VDTFSPPFPSSTIKLEPVPRIKLVDRESFQRDYLIPRRPVVLARMAEEWPALSRWSPEFFRSNYGDRMVKVYDASFAAPGSNYMTNLMEIRFDDYLDKVLCEEADLRMFLYNMFQEIPALRADVILPTIADGFSNRFIFMFFGCRGAVTPIHYDIDMSHVFHTAIYGRKRITLFAADQSARLYRHPFTVRSYVDVDKPDFTRFPGLAGATGFEVILEPGETLFIPSAYWHHVVYQEAGFAISHRCVNEIALERLQGWLNLLMVSPIDRLMNKLASKWWFSWKQRRAWQIAESLSSH